MAAFEEFADPHLVAIYDLLGPDRADIPFYVSLAIELAASSIVDIGCGTGVLACELARRGRRRSRAHLARSLTDAGFSVEQVFGDYDRGPVKEASPELIFVAVRE